MKVTVTNTALINTGDAAIMHGSETILREAFGSDVDISVRDQQSEIAAQLYDRYRCAPLFHDEIRAWRGEEGTRDGILRLIGAAALWRTPLRRRALEWLPESLQASLCRFADSDLIVSAGGTYLVPHYRWGPKLLELLVAWLAGRPYVLFTQSLGPFRPRQLLATHLLRRARAILVRDPKSYAYLRGVGVSSGRIHLCADAAFAMPAVQSEPDRARGNESHIGISVRDWPHATGDAAEAMARYVTAMSWLVIHLVDRYQARVTFVSTCQGVDRYWTDDSRVADKIVDILPESVAEHTVVDREFRGADALRARLSSFDLYVSTRMHGAILALQAGVPVLPIAYEFKTQELFARLGMADIVQDFDAITGEALCRTADEILADQPRYRERIAEEVPGLRRSALSAVPHLTRIAEVAR